MTWTSAGVQSGTDTDLSGLTSVTGTTTTTVGNVTVYTTTSALTVTGTLSLDPLTELLVVTSTSSDSLDVSTGTLIIGSEITSSFGHGRQDITPIQTAIIFAKSGPGCCDSGPFTVGSSGTLELYGAAINLNGCFDVDGIVKIRNGVFYSHNDDGNTRWRSNATPSDYDIDGLTTYGIQFDSLADGTFGTFINFLPLDKGIPIENALGTTGVTRAWRSMPDNTYAADAVMNNWQGLKDVTITLHEAGSRIMVVPDSTTSTTAHGGRLYHEFTVSAFDVLNAPIEDVVCYLSDYDNGDRITTTTTGGNISQGDQVLTPSTGSDGSTSLQTLMTAMFYRTSTSGGDVTGPNGLERTDCRSKPYAVNAAISSSTGVTGTFSSSDDTLPALSEGDRFVLNGSTSNDTQIWEATEDWTTSGGDADRLSSNSTNESENAMSMVVLGEDRYDVYLWGYGYLPYKFTDVVMKGLTQLDLVATLLEDGGITQATQATVDAYTTIDNLNELYDAAMNYKCDSTNIDEPTVSEYIIQAIGNTLDLGDNDLVVNTGATGAFAYNGSDTITIKPTTELDVSSVKTNITTTGDITFTTASIGDGLQLEGTVYLNTAQDLTDVTITGDLYINTGADSTLTFSGVTVTGDVYNDATGNTLTISLTNGSSATAGDDGTGNGQTSIVQTVPIKVTVKDAATLGLIQGARVYIKTAAGGPAAADVELINDTTDGTGEVNTTMSYEGDQPVVGTVRKGTV